MKMVYLFLCALLTACATGVMQDGATIPGVERAVSRLLYGYESSTACRNCHTDQYQQYENSMHAKAFSNPLFNVQYFNDVVPRAQRNPALVPEARRCVACHAPTVFMNYTGLVSTPAQADRFETGVTCDFCHTLAGYAENGDYEQNPSGKKMGSYQASATATHHSEYSGYVQVGEFCGRCHNATNHIGLEVKSTYYEWRESGYGLRGFACQECHMNKNGYLTRGRAEFDQGQAAYLNIGTVNKKQREHEKLYNHSFPGAHSVSQLEEALLLEFKVGVRTADATGMFPFTLIVNNERSGHKMPSGSSDLRFMWLELKATAADGTNIPVSFQAANNAGKQSYSIAGASPEDASILGTDVPSGSRLYRTVFVNADGRQSLYQYDAVEVAFDNRLNAEEIRKEECYLKLPRNFSGKVTLEARLYYRGAPSSFTRRIQAPEFAPALVASQKKLISIEAHHASGK